MADLTEVQRRAYLENLRRYAGKDISDETLNTALQYALKSGARNILKAAQDYCRNLAANPPQEVGGEGNLQDAMQSWREHLAGEQVAAERRRSSFHKKLWRVLEFCSDNPFPAYVPQFGVTNAESVGSMRGEIRDYRSAANPPLEDGCLANESDERFTFHYRKRRDNR